MKETLLGLQTHVTNLIIVTLDYTYQNMPRIVTTVASIQVTVDYENTTTQSPTTLFGLGNSFHGLGSPQTNCRIEDAKTILIQIRLINILNRLVRGSSVLTEKKKKKPKKKDPRK